MRSTASQRWSMALRDDAASHQRLAESNLVRDEEATRRVVGLQKPLVRPESTVARWKSLSRLQLALDVGSCRGAHRVSLAVTSTCQSMSKSDPSGQPTVVVAQVVQKDVHTVQRVVATCVRPDERLEQDEVVKDGPACTRTPLVAVGGIEQLAGDIVDAWVLEE